MKKVFVAVPTTGDVVDSQEFFMRDIRERYKDKIEFVYPKRLVRRIFHDFARNALVEDFLDSGADVMWFLDSDVTPALHTPDLITEHWDKWKVAGAVYPVWMTPPGHTDPKIVFTAYTKHKDAFVPEPLIPHQGISSVDGLATGCMFIKREVFTEILPDAPYFKFSFDDKTCAMREGEDFYFMRRCNEKGLKFFTDFSMVCKHQKRVDLLDMQNYAAECANSAVAAYDRVLREQIAGKMNRTPQTKSSIILPQWSR